MTEPYFTFEGLCDELGPAKVVHLYEPSRCARGRPDRLRAGR